MTGTTAPIVGATVTLWSTGMTATQVGTSATTDASGHFSFSFNCPAAGTLMYVTASGGQIGTTAANAQIQMTSALGACGNMPASIVVNEFTSAAAVYALSGFAGTAGATPVAFSGKSPGLDQAFVTLATLVIPSTGTWEAPARVTNGTVVQQRLDTVASAMAACNASTTSGPCAELTSCARVAATYVSTGAACTGGTSTLTADSLNAGLAIVQNAGLVSAAGIFDVATAGGAAFSPVLSAAPEDWALPLVFSITNYGPLAIDAGGHVWMLGPDPHPASPSPAIPNLAVAEIDADASFLSPHQTGHDWSAGGVSAIQGNDITNFAIDQSGNVWVGGSGTTVAELTSSGAGAGTAPYSTGTAIGDTSSVTIDSLGNAWFVSGNASTVFELSSTGLNTSTSSGYSASNCACDGMAADSLGNVWVVSSGANQFLAQIAPNGTQSAIINPPSNASHDGVYTFLSVANDATGKLWITDQHNHGVWSYSLAGPKNTSSYSSTVFNNAASPGTKPKGIAIDGAGHKWVANNPLSGSLTSVSELSTNGMTNLSPPDGFGFGVIPAGAYGIAIDGSGNVWVTSGGNTLVEFVGAAAPTRNPIVTAITAGSFAP